MMNFDTINVLVASMGGMKFFPSDPAARAAVVETVSEMAETEDQVRWLTRRMRILYAEWPGEAELRACFCSRFRPRDGITRYSSVFPDGIPSERTAPPLALPGPRGDVISADRQIEAAVGDLARARRLPQPIDPMPQKLPPPLIAETRTQKFAAPVTQADVDREVAKLRDRLRAGTEAAARKEAGIER
jgi:hypothetical protein